MYICLIYTCIYTKVFEVIQEDMRHLRLSFDIVWQWKKKHKKKTLDYKADWQFTNAFYQNELEWW